MTVTFTYASFTYRFWYPEAAQALVRHRSIL